MRSELRPLIAPLGLERSGESGAELFRGAAGRVEVTAAITGIGMRAGARCAERILDALSPDHLLVVGIAGGIGPSVAVGDRIAPELVWNLETGERSRPTPLGDLAPRGTLVSSDGFLVSPEDAEGLRRQGVVAIDMETAAIGGVCERRGCPWSVFRAISDRADNGTADPAVLGLVDPDGRPRLVAAVRFVLARPHHVPRLLRLARGARAATHAAASAAVAALESM
jgi:adenosylhomocysteine nucleosidase